MNSQVYPENFDLFHAAKALGRPVKWTDERGESFVSDSHGRDHEMTAELPLDAEGNSLAASPPAAVSDRLRRSADVALGVRLGATRPTDPEILGRLGQHGPRLV